MRLLDRYILRNFFQTYAYCVVGFFSIWLIFDVSDNISTFLDERIHFSMVVHYYLTQIPQILVILLPVSLLLALLFTLGRMSRANEIVSMLTAGVSVPRVLLPLFAIGFLTAIGSGALNYAMAPHADLARRQILEDPNSRRHEGILGQVFKNRTDNRIWFVRFFKPGDNKFSVVQILQQDTRGRIVKNYLATNAIYHPEAKSWELLQVKVVTYDAVGNIVETIPYAESITINQWSETPFRLASANVRAEFSSVPELREYLKFNSDFPVTLLAPFATHFFYRLALPWNCLVVVLIAAPLAIGYSRRGILTSVASAIFLVFAMNFLTHLFLALGEGSRIPPVVAAWTPNLIFAIIGFVLLYYRSTNRERPRLGSFGRRAIVST